MILFKRWRLITVSYLPGQKGEVKMELKFLYPYKMMQKYIGNVGRVQNAWGEIMIALPFAGYYFGSKIVSSFMERHTDIGFVDLIKIPHQTIFNESIYGNE